MKIKANKKSSKLTDLLIRIFHLKSKNNFPKNNYDLRGSSRIHTYLIYIYLYVYILTMKKLQIYIYIMYINNCNMALLKK